MQSRVGDVVLIELADARPVTSGGKAAPLARLLRAGLPVPPGFVVPIEIYEQSLTGVDVTGASYQSTDCARLLVDQVRLAPGLIKEITSALNRIAVPSGDGCVAVRSSANTEDGTEATAAGQHDTFLGLQGSDQVVDAIRRCWVSLWSGRAVAYRRSRPAQHGVTPPAMAVLVQRLVDADVAGVLFTGARSRIEASWGLGESVVGGRITPDTWLVSGGTIIDRSIGTKSTRIDRSGTQLETRLVSATDQRRLCLHNHDVLELAELGRRIEHVLGGPQDIEWAMAGDQLWILQARPITADLPAETSDSSRVASADAELVGTPASPGRATGPVRLVHGPADFAKVRSGDILVCRTTDPAWTPLFGLAVAVITETGGMLCHAAIVARERRLPAVLAVPNATTTLIDGALATVDGDRGLVVLTADSTAIEITGDLGMDS